MDSGSATVSNTTIVGNSHGAYVDAGAVTVVSSVLARNDAAACSGSVTVTDGGHNFADDTSCPQGFNYLSVGSLGVLGDNGCAVTTPIGCVETLPLRAGSSAVDAGDCTGVVVGLDASGNRVVGDLDFDQRGDGFPRTLGSGCDAGAFESEAGGSFEGLAFVPVMPCAVYDTRTPGAIGVGQQTLTAQITGSVGQSGTACASGGVVPANAAAVMVNVVAVSPVANGDLRVSASGSSAEGGVVNFGPGDVATGTNSNAVPVGLPGGGAVDVVVNAASGQPATHVRLLILGYYT